MSQPDANFYGLHSQELVTPVLSEQNETVMLLAAYVVTLMKLNMIIYVCLFMSVHLTF